MWLKNKLKEMIDVAAYPVGAPSYTAGAAAYTASAEDYMQTMKI